MTTSTSSSLRQRTPRAPSFTTDRGSQHRLFRVCSWAALTAFGSACSGTIGGTEPGGGGGQMASAVGGATQQAGAQQAVGGQQSGTQQAGAQQAGAQQSSAQSMSGAATTPAMVAVPPPVSGGSLQLTQCETPGPRMVRRLNPVQYYKTLQSLFQDTNVPKGDALSDPVVLGFHADADAAVVRDLDAEILMNYAEMVADWAVTSKLSQLSSCTTNDATCRKKFISSFGEKVHREPLTDAQVTAYDGIFAAETSFSDGAKAFVTAVLQSPYLLYRREIGQGSAGPFKLSSYEKASELAYLMTDSPPDQQLYDAAKNNRLNTPEDVTREAERLLTSAAGKEVLARFVDGWLETDKLTSKAKNENIKALPADVRASLQQEVRELFTRLLLEGGTVSDLFQADYTYIDQKAGTFYGIQGASSATVQKVSLKGSNRPKGILGHGAWLATHAQPDNSSPVQRAKIVIERLICGHLTPPPQGLDTALKVGTTFETNRKRFEFHEDNEQCRGCHKAMDPIGFAFENYDGFGLYRAQENGHDIDATGSMSLIAGGPYPLNGVDSLSDVLAKSPEVQACVVRYLSYFAYGRDAWTKSECNRDGIIRSAQAQNFSLKSVLLGAIAAPHFSQRVAE